MNRTTKVMIFCFQDGIKQEIKLSNYQTKCTQYELVSDFERCFGISKCRSIAIRKQIRFFNM